MVILIPKKLTIKITYHSLLPGPLVTLATDSSLYIVPIFGS